MHVYSTCRRAYIGALAYVHCTAFTVLYVCTAIAAGAIARTPTQKIELGMRAHKESERTDIKLIPSHTKKLRQYILLRVCDKTSTFSAPHLKAIFRRSSGNGTAAADQRTQ